MTRTALRRLLLGAGLATAGCGAPANSIDVRDYPPEMQTRYALFEKRCTRCHEMERPLNAHVSEGGWTRYVRRMARHPAAGISLEEQREIATFLEYHAQREASAAAASAAPASSAPSVAPAPSPGTTAPLPPAAAPSDGGAP